MREREREEGARELEREVEKELGMHADKRDIRDLVINDMFSSVRNMAIAKAILVKNDMSGLEPHRQE